MCLHLTNREVPSIRIDPNVSRNFQVAKVLSILAVVLGHSHFLQISIWVPVTIGLLVFSFSSGYFTSLKYNGNFSRKEFWLKKARRLGVNLAVINIFLLILFLIQGRSGIWTWHTIVNMLGLNGFLNWFYIQNLSPFGAGMWFFYPAPGFLSNLPYAGTAQQEENRIISFCRFICDCCFLLAQTYSIRTCLVADSLRVCDGCFLRQK